MNPEGEIRELAPNEKPAADKIELDAKTAAYLEALPQEGRIGHYKGRKLMEQFRNNMLKLKPKSSHRKRKKPKSVLSKSLRKKR